MKHMSLLKKFLLSGAATLAVVMFLIVVVAMAGARIRESGYQLQEHEIPLLQKAYQLKLAVVQVQQYLSDIGATRGQDGLDDGFKLAAAHAGRFRDLVADLKRLDAADADRLKAMSAAFEQYYRVGRRMAQAYVSQGPAGGNAMMGEFDAAAGKLSDQVDPFLKSVTDQAYARLGDQRRSAARVENSVLAAGVVVLLILSIIGFVFYRTFAKMRRVSAELARVAEGDLTGEELHHGAADEMGQLCEGLNVMRARLKRVIGEVAEASETMASTAGELSVVTQQSEGAVSNVNSEVTQVATAMNELSATSQEVARHSAETAEAAGQADADAGTGRQVTQDAVEAIRAVAREMEQSAEVVQTLDRNAENIGSILDVITGIADQTNLLALNAAIEAARAGEQGRGFAVVADEVRNLAHKSAEATQEIQTKIDALQAGAKNAVSAMESGRAGVERSVALSAEAGERLSAIAEAVTRINEMSAQIATAAEEQSNVVDEMNANVTQISTATEETASASRQVAGSGQEMAEQAESMQQLVKQFKV